MNSTKPSLPIRSLALLSLWALAFSSTALLVAQDKPDAPPEENPGEPEEKGRPSNAEGYNEYMEISEATYVPPAKDGDPQAVQLKFNLTTDIPKGCKLRIGLELFSLPVEETEYVLKDENRKGLTLLWKAKDRLATGEYRLRTHIDLENQTPAVQRVLKGIPKVFPPKSAPWSWYSKTQVKVGSPEDEAREAQATCETYTGLLDKLVANWDEFKTKIEAVKAGKELVNGGALDSTKLEAFVKEWREKQGQVQKEILLLPGKEPALIQKSQSAHVKIMALGRMVSKAAVQIQKEATDHYKVPLINPAVKDFDKTYPYKASEKQLQQSYEDIRRAAGCADATEAPAEAGAGGDEQGAPGAEPAGGTPTDPPKADEPKGTEPAPEKNKKAAKKPEKKAK